MKLVKNKTSGLFISQIIITAFLIVNMMIFFINDSIAAKTFAATSFFFMFLFVISLKTNVKER